MSRPIYEPTTQRQLSYQGFGSDQLFRRPSPVTDGGVISSFRARRNFATQNIPTDQNIAVCWDCWEICDTEIFSEETFGIGDCADSLLDVGLNVSGVYAIHVQLQYDETLTFKSAVGVYDFTTTRMWYSLDNFLDVGTAFPSLTFQAVRAYNIDDAVRIRVETIQNSGSDKTIGSDDTGVNNFFQIFYLGPYDCEDCVSSASQLYIGGGGSCTCGGS